MGTLLTIGYSAGFVVLAGITAYALTRRLAALGVVSLFAVFYLHIRPLILITDSYTSFATLHSIARVFDASLLVPVFALTWLGLTALFIGYSYGYFRANRSESVVIPVHANTRAAVIIHFLFVATVIPFLFSGHFQAFVLLFGACLIGVLSHALVDPTSKRNIVRTLLAVAFVILLLQFTSERRDFAVALLALLFVWVLPQRRNLLGLFVIGGSAISLGIFIAVWLRTPDAIDLMQVLTRITGDQFMAVIEIELDFSIVFDDIVILMDRVPRHEEFLSGETFLKPFFAFVPREIWADKPETISRLFSLTFNKNFYDNGGSEPVTLFGELYWNFGWLGILPMVFFGYLIGVLDQSGRAVLKKERRDWSTFDRLRLSKYLVLSAMLFYFFRGPTDTVWMSFVWVWLVWRIGLLINEVVNSAE